MFEEVVRNLEVIAFSVTTVISSLESLEDIQTKEDCIRWMDAYVQRLGTMSDALAEKDGL